MRNVSLFALLLWSGAVSAGSPLVVYDDALENEFNNGSWGSASDYTLTNASPVYGASGKSISFVAQNWNGLQFIANNAEYNLLNYQSLTFYVNGGTSGGQELQVYVCDDYNVVGTPYPLDSLISGGTIPKNAWAAVTLDFISAGLTSGNFNCVVIMDAEGSAAGQPAVYIDQIVFNPSTSPPPPLTVSINLTANVHSFSPLIFGVAFGDPARNKQMAYTVDRWGGNSTSRYNWQANIYNTVNDYYFENIPNCNTVFCPPGIPTADNFISAARAGGSQPLITIPTIGWTARADSPVTSPYLAGFSVKKYGAQESVDPYDTDAGNGILIGGGQIAGNSPTDTSSLASPSFEAQWIAHLQTTFGTAAQGGVQFYTLDNEIMLWNSTHIDVHPAPLSYDDAWTATLNYATAIKEQEPNAQVTGPVTWGYPDLFTSAKDAVDCGCSDGADRQAHSDLPFVAWYLQQICANPLAGGKHLVDYLDLHYYPKGANVALSDDDSSATATLRLASLKELYDPTWVSQSWIGSLGNTDANHYAIPDLIPRVKAWIDQYCPGTKLAITEYNWGNDGTSSGAIAQAELLAIFAREGVDMATRWIAPSSGTKAEDAFSIFLNYDGAGGNVLGDSVGATSSNADEIGAYAFYLAGQRTMVLLTNKDTVAHDVALTFDSAHSGTWTLYGFTGSSALAQTAAGNINGTTLSLSSLPPISASLLVIPEIDEIFRNGFELP